MKLTQDELASIFLYDTATGLFTFKAKRSNRKAGQVAGTMHPGGYLRLNVNKRCYYAHRLAWLYCYGYYPPDEIDHINGNRTDNRIANLRCATRCENGTNTQKKCTNTSGYKGVHFNSKLNKWCAQATVNRKAHHLGVFARIEDARDAYRSFMSSQRGDFFNPG